MRQDEHLERALKLKKKSKTTGKTNHGIVLVFVTEHPRTLALLRAAKRKALQLQVPWKAIYIEETQVIQPDQETVERSIQSLTLAEHMGAETETEEASSFFQGILSQYDLAEEDGQKVLAIFIGEEEQNGWIGQIRRPLAERLSEAVASDCEVVVVPLLGQIIHSRGFFRKLWVEDITSQEVLYALLTVVYASIAAWLLQKAMPTALYRVNDENIALLFMIACAVAAGRYGLVPGLITAVASFLALNFLFVAPYFHFQIANVTQALNFGLYLTAALLIAFFVSRTHARGVRLQNQLHRMRALFKMYHISLQQHTRFQALEALHNELKEILGFTVMFCLPKRANPDELEVVYPPDARFSEEDQRALNLCWDEGKVTGYASPYHFGGRYRFKPLFTPNDIIGVMAIRMSRRRDLDVGTSRLLSSISDLVALVLDRIALGDAMEESRLREEREKLRVMLLSSVSHDLKTPLASIIGSLSVFRSMSERLPEEHRQTLINTALEEAHRLDSFITNILDMTRIESGQIEFKQEWVRPGEMVARVQKRLKDRLHQHTLEVKDISSNIEICIDPAMSEQVLQNVLDNAGKYTPAGTKITVHAQADGSGFHLMVEDNGPGIPYDKLDSVFDKYARISRQDSQVAGTGLGLAISKSVMQAQGGTITAGNNDSGGAVFTLIWPKWRKVKSNEKVT